MLASWSACLNDKTKFKNGAPIISFFTTGDTGDTSPAPNAIMHANGFTGSPQTSEKNAHISNDSPLKTQTEPSQCESSYVCIADDVSRYGPIHQLSMYADWLRVQKQQMVDNGRSQVFLPWLTAGALVIYAAQLKITLMQAVAAN